MAETTPSDWLRYDFSHALAELPNLQDNILELRRRWCLPADVLEQARDALESARDEALQDLLLNRFGKPPRRRVEDLDPGFMDLPERLLEEYQEDPDRSQVGRILSTAENLRNQVDRVVVLGIGGSYMGARALFEALCDPYHNERSRQHRGGVPRLYFAGNSLENDSLTALLELLRQGSAERLDDRWAVIVVSKSGGTLETAAAFRILQRELNAFYQDRDELLANLIVPITGGEGRLRRLAENRGYRSVFTIPDDVGGRFSIFTPVGLVPAAFLGIDIVRLLEGAELMCQRFRNAAVGDNPVLDYAGISYLLERDFRVTVRVLALWSDALEAIGLWYDQLLAESLGKDERGATPVTAVNPRDLHSRGQQHQQGRRDKLVTNVVVEQPRRDPVALGSCPHDEDKLNRYANETVPTLLQAAEQGTRRAYRDAGRPTADIVLPRLDEFSLGQLFQMLMLATVVEGRLAGINPYGQPGVEAYKQQMFKILDKRAVQPTAKGQS